MCVGGGALCGLHGARHANQFNPVLLSSCSKSYAGASSTDAPSTPNSHAPLQRDAARIVRHCWAPPATQRLTSVMPSAFPAISCANRVSDLTRRTGMLTEYTVPMLGSVEMLTWAGRRVA